MNLLCNIFGHKLIHMIWDGPWDSEYYRITVLNLPICKRCGLNVAQIRKLEGIK